MPRRSDLFFSFVRPFEVIRVIHILLMIIEQDGPNDIRRIDNGLKLGFNYVMFNFGFYMLVKGDFLRSLAGKKTNENCKYQ